MSENDDCPLCLEPYHPVDHVIPVPCPNRACHFNFCLQCINKLIASSKDAPGMASDGNIAIKVKQTCPQCRSDLSNVLESIVDKRKQKISKSMQDIKDSDLNATELRLKHLFVSEQKSCETEFFDEFVDFSMFGGMGELMSNAERVFVTELMTSGDVDKVAQASSIVSSMIEMSLTKPRKLPQSTNRPNQTRSYVHRTSRAEMSSSRAAVTTARQREEENRKARILAHRRAYPLPVRMPKCVTFDSEKKDKSLGYGMKFTNDLWDGSIMDAFRYVTVKKGEIERSKNLFGRDGQKQNVVEKMLGNDAFLSNADLYTVPSLRVVIVKVGSQAGQLGLQKGDVITHVNGEGFKGTANDLECLLDTFEYGEKFTLVVNAEKAVAESLKVRHMALMMSRPNLKQ